VPLTLVRASYSYSGVFIAESLYLTNKTTEAESRRVKNLANILERGNKLRLFIAS